MSFSYDPLWKLLIDKKLKKEDLRIAIGASSSTMAKMGKDEYISMKILDQICNYLNCNISNIVEHKKGF